MAKPLAGIKVIELANFIAGPLCGTLLADMGADVIKVEPPKGDMARATPPIRNGESVSFVALNRNKRSLVLDLKRPEAAEILLKLAAQSDVFHRSLSPGRAGQAWARRRAGQSGQSAHRLHLRLRIRPKRAVSPPRRRQPDHRSVLRDAIGDGRAGKNADAAGRADGRCVRRAVCDLRHARRPGRRRAHRRRLCRRRVTGGDGDCRLGLGSGRLSRVRQDSAAAWQQTPAQRAVPVVRVQGRPLSRHRHAQRPAVQEPDDGARPCRRMSTIRATPPMPAARPTKMR